MTNSFPGVAHLAVGILAFYHAIGSLSQAYTGKAIVPLGPPLLYPEEARGRSLWSRYDPMGEPTFL